MEKREQFAAFYVANFVPWEVADASEDCKPLALVPETLRAWQDHLNETAVSVDVTPRERTIARGRLFAMRQFAHALTIDNMTKQVMSQWRARNREQWSDTSKSAEQAADGGAKGTGKKPSSEEVIDEFLEGQRERNVDPKVVQLNALQECYMERMLGGMRRVLPPSEQEEAEKPKADTRDEPLGTGTAALRGSGYCGVTVDRAQAKLESIKELPPPAAPAGQLPNHGHAAAGHASGGSAHGGLPPEFARLAPGVLSGLVRTWEEDAERAKEQGVPPPEPPLNEEQRAIGRAMMPALDAIGSTRRRVAASPRPSEWRKVYWDDGTYTSNEHLFLLSGAAGTGKTEVIKVVNRVLRERSIGTLALSAYTGAAVVQLENAVTLLTLLFNGNIGIPYRQQSLDENVTVEERTRFARYVDVNELVVLVIDEISFINATTLHHIDRRLQKLLENDAPFGGLVVVLAGDFQQKPTTNGTPLHKALLTQEGLDLPDATGKKRRKAKTKGAFHGTREVRAEHKGVDLFRTFNRLCLTVSHRFRKDPTHGRNLKSMRNTVCDQPVSDAFLESLQPVGRHEQERFAFATIGVVSNVERTTLNAAQVGRSLCIEFEEPWSPTTFAVTARVAEPRIGLPRVS